MYFSCKILKNEKRECYSCTCAVNLFFGVMKFIAVSSFFLISMDVKFDVSLFTFRIADRRRDCMFRFGGFLFPVLKRGLTECMCSQTPAVSSSTNHTFFCFVIGPVRDFSKETSCL